MNQELQELIRQRKELDKKIAAYKSSLYFPCGSVKLEKRDIRKWQWQISARGKYGWNVGANREEIEKDRWWPFIRENTKEEALQKIDVIIHDLQELKKMASEDREVEE